MADRERLIALIERRAHTHPQLMFRRQTGRSRRKHHPNRRHQFEIRAETPLASRDPEWPPVIS